MAKEQDMIPFKKLKRGGFFRFKGRKSLWQKGVDGGGSGAQAVTGPNVGSYKYSDYGYNDYTLVIPVNAKIVEEK